MANKKPARNQRKSSSHKERYGMNTKEWARFKRTNPEEAHEIRVAAQEKLPKLKMPKPVSGKKK